MTPHSQADSRAPRCSPESAVPTQREHRGAWCSTPLTRMMVAGSGIPSTAHHGVRYGPTGLPTGTTPCVLSVDRDALGQKSMQKQH